MRRIPIAGYQSHLGITINGSGAGRRPPLQWPGFEASGCHELLEIRNLLRRAVAIEKDLSRRLLKHPGNSTLWKQHRQYEQLVNQLAWEYRFAIDRYLATILKRLLNRQSLTP